MKNIFGTTKKWRNFGSHFRADIQPKKLRLIYLIINEKNIISI